MNQARDRLYELLPHIYRERDAEEGYPLRALLRIMTEQWDVLEDDIAQLYDNWFIETCQEWVVPYIGDLIGYRPVHEAGDPSAVTTSQGQPETKILVSRREIANTIRYRQRKGTVSILELLARDVAGWPAHAVEFYKRVMRTQHINHLRLKRGTSVNLHDSQALVEIDGPFDKLAHVVDVRRIASHRTAGRYNLRNVGVFVWRLKSYSVTKARANYLQEEHFYAFSILGNDTPLYNKPQSEITSSRLPEALKFPTAIGRRAFEQKAVDEKGEEYTQASDAYYGVGKSLAIWAAGWPTKDSPQPIPSKIVIPADLSQWGYLAPRNFILVDPEIGRIVFPERQLPPGHVFVSYHYAFSANMGGGEYDRGITTPTLYDPVLKQTIEVKLYRVCRDGSAAECAATIQQALDQWQKDAPRSAIIEIGDSDEYVEILNIALEEGQSLELRAANHRRPVIRLYNKEIDRPEFLQISGKSSSRFVVDGLLVTGRGLRVSRVDDAEGDLCDMTIRHSTLVPGWALDSNCEPKHIDKSSLELVNTGARIVIDHSIIGSVRVIMDEVKLEPVQIYIGDSIVDATEENRPALSGDEALAYAALTVERSTVIGQIQVHMITLAENSIFFGSVKVGRRQQGCMRFCYVSPDSRTPRRFACQPDLVKQAVVERVAQGGLLKSLQDAEQEREAVRVRPQFNSPRYGKPTYCQLANTCAEEIRSGAEDESEMGVFHDLYQPQRAANLRARLDEYTPIGMEAGIIFAS